MNGLNAIFSIVRVPENDLRFDEVGYWSELKLDIIRSYAAEYSKILSAQPNLRHLYIDAFSGSGIHIAKSTGEPIPGSPLNALSVEPPFREFHLIDLNPAKVDHLRALIGNRPDVKLYHGDCNEILRGHVFPLARFQDFRRALCLLDPYGLHLEWDVIREAGQMRSIEIFLNFPVADMNRNVLWRDASQVSQTQIGRMNSFWGDESWRDVAYSSEGELFPDQHTHKATNQEIADAFRRRLKDVAGFAHVPSPIPMHNSKGAVVYYLFFASPKPVAAKIVKHIFDKYRTVGTH